MGFLEEGFGGPIGGHPEIEANVAEDKNDEKFLVRALVIVLCFSFNVIASSSQVIIQY